MAESGVGGLDLRDALLGLGLAPGTIADYVRAIERADRWLSSHGAGLAVAKATDIAAYVESQPSSWSNRNLMRAAFGRYWSLVERERPPLKAIRVPPQPEGTCKALDEDDARVMAKYAAELAHAGDRRGLAVLFGLFSALRRSEIAGRHARDFVGREMRVIGKGRKEAWIPLHSRLEAVLPAWLADRPGFLFRGRIDGHVGPSTVWQWSLDVAAEAGLPGRVPTHHLRHTALATANDNTGDLRAVQDLARHTKIQTTTIYTRTKKAKLRAVVESIDY